MSEPWNPFAGEAPVVSYPPSASIGGTLKPVLPAESATVTQSSGHPVQKWWGFFASESFLLALFSALSDYGIVVPANTRGLLMVIVGGAVAYRIPRKAGE